MRKIKIKRGDTIVEVSFSIAVFSLVAILTIQLMNNGMSNAQANLEVTMARNEINAQGEALRYIHNSYLSERELEVDCSSPTAVNAYCQNYRKLWTQIVKRATTADKAPDLQVDNCDSVYKVYNPSTARNGVLGTVTDTANTNPGTGAFVLNTRSVVPTNISRSLIYAGNDATNKFRATPTYPRLVYGNNATHNSDNELYEDNQYVNVQSVEGIWITAVKSGTNYTGANRTDGTHVAGLPEYYDFHIYSCWYAPGRNVPTTIGTIVRLYNPEIIERARS